MAIGGISSRRVIWPSALSNSLPDLYFITFTPSLRSFRSLIGSKLPVSSAYFSKFCSLEFYVQYQGYAYPN